jgi:CheY-like chemotaxis protein
MDVQMPVMGGFECTTAIRERERSAGTHLPIVAMTAHAMKGSREKCVAVGMDDYVAKPFRPQELFAAIERGMRSQPGSMPAETDDAIFVIGNDAELRAELEAIFRETCPIMLARLREAVADEDANAAASNAAALRLEMIGHEGRLQEAPAALADLERGLEHLDKSLGMKGEVHAHDPRV